MYLDIVKYCAILKSTKRHDAKALRAICEEKKGGVTKKGRGRDDGDNNGHGETRSKVAN